MAPQPTQPDPGLSGSSTPPPDMQTPLMLVMPVDMNQLANLKTALGMLKQPQFNIPLSEALDKVGVVHFTRFVLLEDDQHGWAKLIVDAIFDGTVPNYIAAFARELNLLFNTLFPFVEDHPTLPVEHNVDEFIAYVSSHDVQPAGNHYSAYAGFTALDIAAAVSPRDGATHGLPAQADRTAGAASSLDLDDIQGLILRGYRKDVACHLILEIIGPDAFRAMLGDLADEDAKSGPFITVANDWTEKPPAWNATPSHAASRSDPPHCVNLGFTYDGLQRLGLNGNSLQSFPAEFREGAEKRAAEVLDDGPSAPAQWKDSLRAGKAHVVVSVYADDEDELNAVVAEVLRRASGAAIEIDRFNAQRLRGGDVVHFGYRDGLSQPTIDGAPLAGRRDPFPPVPAGEFVLGQPTQRDAPWDPLPQPDALGRNGSFAAFRVMAQDVEAFEQFLTTESQRVGIGRELLAAKLCGRWRNGEPLMMRPANAPAGTIPGRRLNMFDYAASAAFPDGDPEGVVCPYGAHIRRAFPRGQRVIDDLTGFQRRIVRRGMPYGPWYDPRNPTAADRGLVGMFICASLRNQFEYVMRNWLNDGLFTGGLLGRTRDPMVGANDPADSRFTAPGTPRVEATGFSRFVTTVGCVYLFLPSMTALRYLASGAPQHDAN